MSGGGKAIGPHDLPVSNGVDWATGDLLPVVDPRALDEAGESDAVPDRSPGNDAFLVSLEIENANDLSQAGWGVLYGINTPPEVKAQLRPLLELRKSQATPYVVFDGLKGVKKGESVRDWLEKQDVTLAVVNPALGVPFYLLVVASPEDITFEFQFLLDSYFAVGRLHFDTLEDYGRYARNVVTYETGASVPNSRTAAVFAPRNDGDRATAFLLNQFVLPVVDGVPGKYTPLGQKQNYRVKRALADDATKEALQSMLTDTDRPALLFTGSHGTYADETVVGRSERIGAIVTQEWGGPGSPLKDSCCYTAADLDADNCDLTGVIHFFFACYSAGCPEFDTYTRPPDGSRKRLLSAPLVAKLPLRMLARGALAVLGHMDRAFAYSFQTSRLAPQVDEMRDVLNALLKGWRIGRATDQFNIRWTVLSAELSEALRDRADLGNDPGAAAQPLSDVALSNRWIARDDARNYVILGDPAVRLREEDLR